MSHRWSPQTVIHLAAMFSDVPLSSEELRFVLEKIIRQFDDLDLRDIPSLVYQLLLLSEKVSLGKCWKLHLCFLLLTELILLLT